MDVGLYLDAPDTLYAKQVAARAFDDNFVTGRKYGAGSGGIKGFAGAQQLDDDVTGIRRDR